MNDQHTRQQLVNALAARQAHLLFETAIHSFPPNHYNSKPPNLPYSFWHLLEHLRITQADILNYIENPHYQYLKHPEDYWPPPDAQADSAAWQRTINDYLADRAALVAIVQDPARDLTAQIPHAQPGHTILREILVIAAHNSYHIGEFGILRATLGLW
ncbi:MAG: DinB family protein [Chloroflexi bacterium]|nr:DinB family protein [Chloroflexota bacterium]